MADERDQSMTFRELVVIVAKMFGMNDYSPDDGEPLVPSDPGNLAFCKRIVRQAFRRLVNDNPRWRWLRQRLTIDIIAAQTEYAMPWWFDGQEVEDRFTYASGGPRMLVRVVPESKIRELESANSGQTGDPQLIAFYLPTNTATAGHPVQRFWKALVYPTPTEAQTLTGVARAVPSQMWDLGDRHFAGPSMNALVESACRAEAEMESEEKSGERAKRYAQDLAAAAERDAESGPRILGRCTDPEDDDPPPPKFGTLSLNGTVLA